MSESNSRIVRFVKDQRIAFLMVGGFNTAFGFGAFVAADFLVGRPLDPVIGEAAASLVTLVIAHIVGVLMAFVLYRRFVFKVVGHVWRDLARFESVYLLSLGINAVVLPILVTLGAPRIPAQLAITIATAVISYVAHKYFSFRRPAAAVEEQVAADD